MDVVFTRRWCPELYKPKRHSGGADQSGGSIPEMRAVKKLALALILAVLAGTLIVVGAQVAMGMLINNLSHQAPAPARPASSSAATPSP
ncbi:hypothetical protein SAT01_34740 [Sinomonas atrocyanea]|nr:hypothetical protein SAT01_34740 [Sinomonas atrocyanea]GGG70300.1 hypothetical protein GCM10007172_23190 [Sinomonas atrocyanea]